MFNFTFFMSYFGDAVLPICLKKKEIDNHMNTISTINRFPSASVRKNVIKKTWQQPIAGSPYSYDL